MTFAARITMLCVLLVSTIGATGEESFPQFVARMRAATGPVWNAHVVSIARVTQDQSSTVVATESQGMRFWLRRCRGALCAGSYFDGTRLFDVTLNDTALPRAATSQPYLRALQLFSTSSYLAPDFAGARRRLVDGGTQTIDGVQYRRILVDDADAVPIELFVDPRTALLHFAVESGERFEYRDERRIDGGFTLPFSVLENGKLLERFDDRTAVAGDLHPPGGLQPSFDGSPAAIPTDPARTTPVFDCAIAGVPTRCLLDSGNSGLSISSQLAQRLGVSSVGSFTVHGVGGYTTDVVRAGPLRAGNATWPPAYYVVLDDIHRYGYDVVLGADVFGATAIELDGAAHSVRFGASQGTESARIALRFDDFVPVVDVQLVTTDASLAVDTGDESNINLSDAFYAKHSGLFATTQQRTVSGVGGSSVELLGEISNVTIGNVRTGMQTIGVTQGFSGTAFGHVGAGFLAQFVTVFDYASEALYLRLP